MEEKQVDNDDFYDYEAETAKGAEAALENEPPPGILKHHESYEAAIHKSVVPPLPVYEQQRGR